MKGRIKHYLEQRKQFPKDVSIDDIEEWIEEIETLYVPDPYKNAAMSRSQVKKGMSEDGTKFDSFYEFVFYCYYKRLKGYIVERNKTQFLQYFNEENKQRKFFPDFIIAETFYEVKGFFRASDILKQEQCPEVVFISTPEINEMKYELDKSLPGWKREFLQTN